ncbi:hypothetical protein [Streptomyces sp. NRRL S-118]|uniref:hypothetical protein n=1 Tax=Streptomyces sp. NRRL S-118 TaxID=1463881 RepID=UPI00131DDE1F|nr:hypothetical protein [Streptomyces sp. NRRL S-118]
MTLELHVLYHAAGRPSLRRIEGDIRKTEGLRDTVTYELIRRILKGQAGPTRWEKIDAIVRVLAARANPRRDPDSEAARFLPLWTKAFDPNGEVLVAAATEVVPNARPDGPVAEQDSGLSDDGAPEDGSSAAGVPKEIRNVMALLPPKDLVSLYRNLLAEDRNGEASQLLVAIGRLCGPYKLIEVIEALRMNRLHEEGILAMRKAVESWNIWDVETLVQLFWKERWEVDALIEAISAVRSVEDVVQIIRLIRDVSPPEADALKRKFDELRDADQVEELEEALDRPVNPAFRD